MRVAIVGMGISGMGVLNEYYKEQISDVEIDCYDSENSFGRGFPFRQDSKAALLNVRPEIIAFDYQKPEEFKDWLEARDDYRGHEFVPRFVYGEFLHERVMQVIQKLNAGVFYEKVKDLDYFPEQKIWLLKTEHLEKEYDRVHLCCGELPFADYYGLSGNEGYIHELYPMQESLKHIPADASVGIIGTGLSAIDAMRYLFSRDSEAAHYGDYGDYENAVSGDSKSENDCLGERKIDNPEYSEAPIKGNKIYVFSISNIFPTVRQKGLEVESYVLTQQNIKTIKKQQNGFISFRQMDALIKEEYRLHQMDLEKILTTYDQGFDAIEKGLTPDEELRFAQFLEIGKAFNEAWYGMDLNNKEMFKKVYSTYLTLLFGPIPEDTGKLLVLKRNQGNLIILSDVDGIEVDNNESGYLFLDQNKHKLARVDFVINATGQDSSMHNLPQDSLLGRLMNKEIISAYHFGGISAIPESYQVLSPRYGLLSSLSVHGILAKGIELVNNGAKLIQGIAASKVSYLLRQESH